MRRIALTLGIAAALLTGCQNQNDQAKEAAEAAQKAVQEANEMTQKTMEQANKMMEQGMNQANDLMKQAESAAAAAQGAPAEEDAEEKE